MTLIRTIIRNRPILYRLSEKSDYNRVLNFLREHFYPHDPSSHSKTTGRQSLEDEELEMKSIDSGCSVLVTTDDRQQELIGVASAGIFSEEETKSDLQRLIKLSEQRGYPNDLDPVIFVQEMKLRAKLSERYRIDKACYLGITAVRPDFQKLSIGKKTIELNMKCAKDLGITVAFGVSVTEKGIRLMESNNYTPIYVQKYKEYRDYRGFAIYNDFSPEACAKIMCKTL